MAADIVSIGLAIDSRDVKKATGELHRLETQGKKTEKATDGIKKSFGGLGSAAKMLAGAMAAIGAVRFLAGAIEETIQYQRNMNVIENLVKQTGASAWVSAQQLEQQARAIGFSTLESVEGIMAAQQTMLTFRGVIGDVFDRSIMAAADMSAALGQDLKSSTLQLGKALEDPVKGLTALSRSGTVFTDQQKEMVEAMVEAGDVAEAQRFILSELEAQYGGAAKAAAVGLAGSIDTLSQKWQEFKIGLLEDKTGGISAIVDGIGNSLEFVLKVIKSVSLAFFDMGDAIAAYANIAIEIASLNFDTAASIKEQRNQQAALNEQRLADIWDEKKATEQLSETVQRTAEQETAIELKRQAQKAAALEAQKKLAKETRIVKEEETNKQWETDAAMFEEEIKRDQEFYNRKLEIERGYLDSAFGVRSQMAQDAFEFSESIRNQEYQSTLSHGAALINAVSSSGKRMFEFGKNLSIANAIVSGGQAAVDAWKAGMATGGPWAPAIAASYVALSLARTGGLINSIKSQSFGGGGSMSGGGGGAPSATSATQGGTALPQGAEVAQAQPTKELRVTVESDGPHSDGMRRFAENLAETVRDMGSNISLVVS